MFIHLLVRETARDIQFRIKVEKEKKKTVIIRLANRNKK
jgi:hypothetical protein